MQYIIIFVAAFALIIWTIRPLYNFFAKSKYVLLDEKKMSVMDRIKAGLPAFLFYFVLILFVLYPATSNELVSSVESGSVILLQLIIIFGLTRYDKRQTRYVVARDGVRYKKNFIRWESSYQITYKKTWFYVLHKPRFIMRYSGVKIVVPLLSENIGPFINGLVKSNPKVGQFCFDIYSHNRLYYVENRKIAKLINRSKSS